MVRLREIKPEGRVLFFRQQGIPYACRLTTLEVREEGIKLYWAERFVGRPPSAEWDPVPLMGSALQIDGTDLVLGEADGAYNFRQSNQDYILLPDDSAEALAVVGMLALPPKGS